MADESKEATKKVEELNLGTPTSVASGASAPTPSNTPVFKFNFGAQPTEGATDSPTQAAAQPDAKANAPFQFGNMTEDMLLKMMDDANLSSNVIEKLSDPVKRRVLALDKLHEDYSDLKKQYDEERRQLEQKYAKLYEPVFDKRASIIKGDHEPADGEFPEGAEVPAASDDDKSKGIPNFWLQAMKFNYLLSDSITEKDTEVLQHLTDIKVSNIPDNDGFQLEFQFSENPFFTNKTLTKKYVMADNEDMLLDHAEGTDIEWNKGKNVTVKLMKKKAKKGKKPVMKEEPADSFFNFFNPPKIPGKEEEMDEDEEDALQELVEADYDLGSALKDKVYPCAVKWFTGEAAKDEMFMLGDDDDEDDDDEDDLDDDEDDEDGPDGDGGQPANPPECKQQ